MVITVCVNVRLERWILKYLTKYNIMTKSEIIEKLKPRCNGYDLPLSLNIALVAEILTEPSVGENDVLHVVVGSLPADQNKRKPFEFGEFSDPNHVDV